MRRYFALILLLITASTVWSVPQATVAGPSIRPEALGLHSSQWGDYQAGRRLPWERVGGPSLLLPIERDSLSLAPRHALGRIAPRTIRICAIRVEFKEDSVTRTTGNGHFQYAPPAEGDTNFHAERPPHNRQYYMTQLEALARYWRVQSGDLINLEFDVWPAADSGAYRLPDSMGYYGQEGWLGAPIDRLSQLFIDSWTMAQDSGGIDFSQYQAFFLIHAGADWQNDLGYFSYLDDTLYVPSPDDIPTVWIRYTGPVVGPIQEGLILPEFLSQDGQNLSLNGIMAQLFAEMLGLPPMYDTRTYGPVLGWFSIMDQGYNLSWTNPAGHIISGALPVGLTAWEKVYLGFVDPVETQSQVGQTLNYTETYPDAASKVCRVPITRAEYFLVENRQPHPSGDSVTVKVDSLSGLPLGPWNPVTGQFVPDYDLLLPGSGLVIYHVDNHVAWADFDGNGIPNFYDYDLQSDWLRPFIYVEEADGIRDLGIGGGEPKPEDFWYSPNATAFTPASRPNTRTNDNAYSGLSITDISESGNVMSFTVGRSGVTEGFPVRTIPSFTAPALVAAKLTGGTEPEILWAEGEGLYAIKLDGTPAWPYADTVISTELEGDTVRFPLPRVLDLAGDTVYGVPACGDMNDDTLEEIVLLTKGGQVNVLALRDDNSDQVPDDIGRSPFYLPGNELATMSPVIGELVASHAGTEFALGTDAGWYRAYSAAGIVLDSVNLRGPVVGVTAANGIVYILAARGRSKLYARDPARDTLLWEVQLDCADDQPPILADLDGDGVAEIVVVGGGGEVYAVSADSGKIETGFPCQVTDSLRGPAAVGDIDGDGALEIVFLGKNHIWAVNHSGTVCDNFPVRISEFGTDQYVASPLLVHNLIPDGYLAIVLPTGSDGSLQAWTGHGERLWTPPLGLVGLALTTPVLVFPDTGSAHWICAANGAYGDGYIFSFPAGDLWDTENTWGQWGYNAGHMNFIPFVPSVPAPSTSDLMPYAYIYPNPVYLDATFRFKVGDVVRVEIEIRDLAGDFVEKLATDAVVPGAENELTWSARGVESGGYVALVKAIGRNGSTLTQRVKVGVMR